MRRWIRTRTTCAMKFSVIIPTCHRNDDLARCLERLAPGAQTLEAENYEVIVTDDGRTSTAERMVREQFPWARWVQGPRRGPAANRNNGARQAGGEWLVFTDDDCLPVPAFLSSYMVATTSSSVSVLEGKTSPVGIRQRTDMECPANENGGYLWSCNMAVRKDLFEKMEGFDTGFPGPALEDVDFRTRLKKAGHLFVFVPNALVLHPWRAGRGFDFCKLQNRSMAYFVGKHPEAAYMVSYRNLTYELAHKILKQLPPVAIACRGRGVARSLALLVYGYFMALRYARSGKK